MTDENQNKLPETFADAGAANPPQPGEATTIRKRRGPKPGTKRTPKAAAPKPETGEASVAASRPKASSATPACVHAEVCRHFKAVNG